MKKKSLNSVEVIEQAFQSADIFCFTLIELLPDFEFADINAFSTVLHDELYKLLVKSLSLNKEGD